MRTTGSPVPAVSTLSDSPRASGTLNVSTVVELSASSRTANSHTGRCLHGNGGRRGGGGPPGGIGGPLRAVGGLAPARFFRCPTCGPFLLYTSTSASVERRPVAPRP